jgi:P27 family predicted phage terminase small subunit
MRGRKPKHPEQKRREGNLSKEKLPEGPLVIGGMEAPPPPGSLPPEAQALWQEVVTRLHQVGVVDVVDGAALQAMCVQWARAERARAVIAEEGMFALGSTGQLVEHPALAVERAAHAMFLRFAEQYGLTAAARARIAAVLMGGGGKDELDDIVDAEPEPL